MQRGILLDGEDPPEKVRCRKDSYYYLLLLLFLLLLLLLLLLNSAFPLDKQLFACPGHFCFEIIMTQ